MLLQPRFEWLGTLEQGLIDIRSQADQVER